jgi:hypothetical protein
MPEFIYFKDAGVLMPLNLLIAHHESGRTSLDYFDSFTISTSIDKIIAALNNPANTDRVIVI